MIVEQYKSHCDSNEFEVQLLWSNIFTAFLKYSQAIAITNNFQIIKRGNKPALGILTSTEKHYNPIKIKNDLLTLLKAYDLNVGLIITNDIKIIFLNPIDDKQTQESSLKFEYDNPIGFKFVNDFASDSFNQKQIQSFIQEKQLLNKIRSEITIENIKKAIVEYFKTTYSEAAILSALNTIQIKCDSETCALDIYKLKNLDKSILIKGGRKSGKYLQEELSKANLIDSECKFTIAKLNKDSKREAKRYWANPPVEYIYNNWMLVLNDIQKRLLYFFLIKKNEINQNQIYTRVLNNKTLIDLEIVNIESEFKDLRTKLNFGKWLIGKLEY